MKLNATILIILLAIACLLTSCATDTAQNSTKKNTDPTTKAHTGGFIIH